MSEQELGFYFVLPTFVLEKIVANSLLTSSEKLLLLTIILLSNKENFCFATNKELAKRLSTSVSSISSWLKTLRENDYITSECMYKEYTNEIELRVLRVNYGKL